MVTKQAKPVEEGIEEKGGQNSLSIDRLSMPKGNGSTLGILKGLWEVRAGITPGESDEKLTRQFAYSKADYEADCKAGINDQTVFARQRETAYGYARFLMIPTQYSWVEIKWTWL